MRYSRMATAPCVGAAVRASAVLLASIALLASCALGEAGLGFGRERAPKDTALAIGIGFETVNDPDTDWDQMRQRFDDAGVSGYSVSVGRPEWIGFPMPGREEDWAPAVADAQEDDRDLVEFAIEALSDSTDRHLTLTIDVLSPKLVADDPEAGGMFADGKPAADFPSGAEIYEGSVGDRVEQMCRESARMYRPDRIALTELIGDTFFSPTDEELFSRMTGEDGFPRTGEGEVDVADERVVNWQSEIVTSVVKRCARAAEPFGVYVELDARVNWDDPGADRSDSGHRYEDILATGAHLTLWAYTGTGGVEVAEARALMDGLESRFSDEDLENVTVSLGLWGEGDATLDADYLEAALSEVDGRTFSVLITPVSLMDGEHWRVLERRRAADLESRSSHADNSRHRKLSRAEIDSVGG